MRRYIFRRLLLAVPTLLLTVTAVFLLVRVIPGDFADFLAGSQFPGQTISRNLRSEEYIQEVRKSFGLDKPILVQYGIWMKGLVTLDLGKSYFTRQPINEVIRERFPRTLELALLALIVSLVISVPLGILAAIRPDTPLDYVSRLLSISGLAMPNFWVAILVLLGLLLAFHWGPPLEYASPWKDPVKNLQKFGLPALALGYAQAAIQARMIRSSMLEVLRQDYVRTAWAKGLAERRVVLRHAMKNAALPVFTLVGLQLAVLMGGTVIMEVLFNIPGMGKAFFDGVQSRDYGIVQGMILVMAAFLVTLNLVIDVCYSWLDPRVRHE